MRALFTTKTTKWRPTIILGSFISLLLSLYLHALITTIATYPTLETLKNIHSWRFFELINQVEFWQAQAYFISAPLAASHFWWQPFGLGVVIVLFFIAWFIVLFNRSTASVVLYLFLLGSLLSMAALNSFLELFGAIFSLPLQSFGFSLASGGAVALALYFSIAAFVLSLGRWRS